MKPRFEVHEDRAGMWRWRLHDDTGAIVAVGGGHATEHDAQQECALARDAAVGASITEVPA